MEYADFPVECVTIKETSALDNLMSNFHWAHTCDVHVLMLSLTLSSRELTHWLPVEWFEHMNYKWNTRIKEKTREKKTHRHTEGKE